MNTPAIMTIIFWMIANLVTITGGDAGCTGTAVNSPPGTYQWYCSAVTRISYQGVGGNSFYPLVTTMNSETGACVNVSKSFAGKMSPLDEDISVHLRGPLVLKQFAVYVPAAQPNKRQVNFVHGHRHFHPTLRKHAQKSSTASQEAKRDVGDWVTATIDGKVVSWVNQYDGNADCAVPVTATIDGVVVSWTNNYCGPSATETTLPSLASLTTPSASGIASSTESVATPTTAMDPLASSSSAPSSTQALLPGEIVGSGTWSRIAYYDSENQTASGVTFLNNMGGSNGSGVNDQVFGASLSFANVNSTFGAGEPQMFSGTLVSNWEIAIFSDQNCTEDSCSYSRPGAVAYSGFAGSQKAFLMEFQMPDDGNPEQGYNMPAIWFLNGKVPRTQQYGNCSWALCGEFDAFEIMTPGYTQMKATLHGVVQGGVSDYFERPVNSTMKGLVLFNDNNIVVQVLDDDFDFGSSLSLEQINDFTNGTDVVGTNFVLSS